MCQKKDQKDIDSNQIIPQIKKVIRDVDELKDKLSNEPNYRKDSCSKLKFEKDSTYQDDDFQPVQTNAPQGRQRQEPCMRVKFEKEATYQDEDFQPVQTNVPQGRPPCMKRCQREVEQVANVGAATQGLDCQYPTEDRMVRPLITYNGLTDIRYTTDKEKVIHESGVGVQYKLINVVPEIEAPWCKRNGLQDYWMEDPKYARKSVDIYSTPYPCCQHPMRTNRNAAPPRPQQAQAQPQGWDCCADRSNNYGPQAPQATHAIPCNDKRNGKGRFRDIAPVMPREQEFDWKENCNFK